MHMYSLNLMAMRNSKLKLDWVQVFRVCKLTYSQQGILDSSTARCMQVPGHPTHSQSET